jgi:hypothetical protein
MLNIGLEREARIIYFESKSVFCYYSSTNKPTYNTSYYN